MPDQIRSGQVQKYQVKMDLTSGQIRSNRIRSGQIRSDQVGSDLRSGQVRSDQMRADLRLGQIRSGQMKKDPPRSESDPLKVHISEIITALEMLQPPAKFQKVCPMYIGSRPKECNKQHLRAELFSEDLTPVICKAN